MENRVGKNFESLAQRVIYSYAGTLPGFVPVKTEKASEHSQLEMYGFMENLLQKLYEDPSLLALSLQKDDFYEDWALQKTKPKLIVEMRNYYKKINEFLVLLIQIGEQGNIKGNTLQIAPARVKLTANILKRLESLGLACSKSEDGVVLSCDEHPELFPAWKLLAETSAGKKDPVMYFSHCMFDPEHSYPTNIYLNLINDKSPLLKLRSYFEANGYSRVDCRDNSRENEISLDWVKNYGKKDEPLKASWGEREHGGLSIWFDYSKRNQVFFGLRVPRYKELLARFDEMDDRLKELVVRKTKQCDSCGYCTQTDKTGARRPQFVTVANNGSYDLCPLYPGFTYVWTALNDDTASDIISFLQFIDKTFGKKIQN